MAAEWRELCRWDPELPPDIVPPAVEPVIEAVAGALNRPQPLGWGADEEVAEAVDAFTDRAGPAAIEELVCLREALSRRLRGRVPAREAAETWARLQMTIDRAMACAARRAFSQLEQAACFDALTGVLNRRSFEVDMSRELGRVARHRGRFSLVMLDLDGLKTINDTLGHTTGDARLQTLGTALRNSTRREDTAYRLGGDEFAVLLPGATPGPGAAGDGPRGARPPSRPIQLGRGRLPVGRHHDRSPGRSGRRPPLPPPGPGPAGRLQQRRLLRGGARAG